MVLAADTPDDSIKCVDNTVTTPSTKKGVVDRSFANVKPGVDADDYREYTCIGFPSGAPVTGSFEGKFKVSTMDVLGNVTGGGEGGGWVQMRAEFKPNSTAGREYDECSGAPISDTCSAANDSLTFAIPASGNWTARGQEIVDGKPINSNNNPPGLFARGFADVDGKATLRVSVWRVEHVVRGPNINHLVSAVDEPKVKITAIQVK